MDSADERLEVTVHGIVQGVSFRAHTEAEANRLGLTGQVWNNPGGTVGIIAEGPRNRLEDLLSWAEQGPDAATVDKHDVHWATPTGEFKNFVIRR